MILNQISGGGGQWVHDFFTQSSAWKTKTVTCGFEPKYIVLFINSIPMSQITMNGSRWETWYYYYKNGTSYQCTSSGAYARIQESSVFTISSTGFTFTVTANIGSGTFEYIVMG